ncbi:hypothetical protein [Desulfonema magnum]|uniref:Peptidase S74 domain-containing protein n=1 Tax=Desulfonema magnum TaxID=45655 RepID=A0A975GJW6_9BACT|nr:hypothetical protein [Desulfonema magnum]QTA84071.1 Uncharacterized protein dnm_000630 [Desulfonema magnum]
MWTQSGSTISYSGSVSAGGDINTNGGYNIGSSRVLSSFGSSTNIFLGRNAGNTDITGDKNAFIGDSVGDSNSSGHNNTFMGYIAGECNTTGYENTFIGSYAGWKNKTGDDNTFVGSGAGENSNGDENTYIGMYAGNDNSTGSGNVFLGYRAGENEAGSNKLYIANGDDPLIYGEFDNKLVAVNGTLKTQEVIVENDTWPDYVFKDDYRPMPLDELERNIKKNGHLPNIPSAEEVEKNGVSIGKMQTKLLQKIEELTLHVIEQNKRLDQQSRKLAQLQDENGMLKKQVASLQSDK